MSTIFWIAAALAQSGADTGPCRAAHQNPATLVHLQVQETPSENAVADESLVKLAGSGGKVLGYTRIGVRFRPCGGERDLTKERRDFLRRLFAGKHASKTFMVDLHVTPLDVKKTLPLLVIKRDSTAKGENWSTDVLNDHILLPFFRVDRTSTVRIQATLKSTRTYETSVASTVLDIISRASALITPTTPLITEANKKRFNDAANFVDSTVNGLLAVTIDEKVETRPRLNSPDKQQVLAIINVSLPRANDSFASPAFPSQYVGQWEIYAEKFRVSMLADNAVGALPLSQITAASVLDLLIDDKTTLREKLAGSKGVTAARDALAAAKDGAVGQAALVVCRAVAAEATAIGLAPVDAGAAAWAYLADMAMAKAKHDAALAGCNPVEYFPA